MFVCIDVFPVISYRYLPSDGLFGPKALRDSLHFSHDLSAYFAVHWLICFAPAYLTIFYQFLRNDYQSLERRWPKPSLSLTNPWTWTMNPAQTPPLRPELTLAMQHQLVPLVRAPQRRLPLLGALGPRKKALRSNPARRRFSCHGHRIAQGMLLMGLDFNLPSRYICIECGFNAENGVSLLRSTIFLSSTIDVPNTDEIAIGVGTVLYCQILQVSFKLNHLDSLFLLPMLWTCVFGRTLGAARVLSGCGPSHWGPVGVDRCG